MGYNTCNSISEDKIWAYNKTRNKGFLVSIEDNAISYYKSNNVGTLYKKEKTFRVICHGMCEIDFNDTIDIFGIEFRVKNYSVRPVNISQVLGVIKSATEIELV